MLARPSLGTTALVGGVILGGGALVTSYNAYRRNVSFFPKAFAEAPAGPKKIFPASGFIDFKLESAEMVNHNVKKLKFVLPDENAVTGMEPITSLLSKHTPEGAWLPVIRPYTPIITDEPGSVTFMVKKYPNGRGSGKMHSLVPGDSISFRMLSEFPYRPNQFSAIGLIAGGSGITPIYQLIRTVLGNPADTTKLSLVYANNTESDILLRAEMDALAREFPKRFRVSYAVSKGEGAGLIKGYVTKEVLAKTMPNAMEGDKVKMLISGPPPMTEALAGKKGFWGWTQGSMGGALKELGWEKAQVHKF